MEPESARALGRTSIHNRQTRAAELIEQIARAVHFAYQRGILHRDLKPANILISDDSVSFVTDFGLAKQMQAGSDLTVSGAVMGSPHYMSPEQAAGKGREVTVATDIYSLGAIFYHLIAGQPPFKGEGVYEILRQVVSENPAAPRSAHSIIDRELEIVCQKCLRKNPQERYDTAEDLAEDLRRWRCHETIHARPATTAEQFWKWILRHPTMASLIFVSLFSLVTILIIVTTSRSEIKHQRNQAQTLSVDLAETLFEVQLDRVEELILANKPSDATAILAQLVHDYPDNIPAASRLLSLLIETSYATPVVPDLVHQGPVNSARFSPTGDHIVTASDDGTAQVWSVKNGQAIGKSLEHGNRVNYAEFSPDGKRVLTASAEPGTALGNDYWKETWQPIATQSLSHIRLF
jgi:serine/threonine protein kinase